MPSHTFDEALKQVLGDQATATFFSGIAGQGGSPNQRRFNEQRAFDPTFNAFQGALGQQAREGIVPNLNFVDFLNDFITGGGLESQFKGQTRFNQGLSQNFFNPQTRFQFRF